MTEKPVLGISACLLGENVRYDGGHKLDRYLRDVLGPFVRWVPVCPEKECGLPVPREAMRLVGNPASPRLVTQKTGLDHTEKMKRWAQGRLDALEDEDLCGFVFKTRSPSSGLHDAKVYDAHGVPSRKGPGLFARFFTERFPNIPAEDEGRLNDPSIRENFIERVFVFWRWKEYWKRDRSPAGLVAFHTRHKLLVMSHAPRAVSELGRAVASAGARGLERRGSAYMELLLRTLKTQATVKKHVNVLQHAMGYFKRVLDADEKQELLEVIGSYQKGLVPLVVPLTLINHHVRKFREPYLGGQIYLNPHPIELMLRNHV